MSKLRMIRGDCLVALKKLSDNSIDFILTDPPYGTTACKWDTVIPFEPMWEQIWRILKPNGACALFGSEPFSSHLRMSQIKYFKYQWYWKKERGTNFLNFKYQPSKEIEDVVIFGKKATSYSKKGTLNYYPVMRKGKPYKCKQGYIGVSVARDRLSRTNAKNIYSDNCGERYPSNLCVFKNEKKLHPTQKPVPLLEYLIKTYTLENETVLDFTMGSGSTGVACKNLNRNFIGIELDKEYFRIAVNRIKSLKKKLKDKNG